ncbi:MAG: cation diffusion facilitator family transporter [Candidatus Helarchaeota archaeon]
MMVKISAIMKVALLLLITKIFLFVIKFIFGNFIGSLALVADSINSGADIVVALGIFIGIKFAEKDASPKYPYGFHKIENIIELFIAFGIFYAGYMIFSESILNFGATRTSDPDLGLVITGISLIISVILMIYLTKKGTQMNSPMIIAEGKDSKIDILSTSLVFVALGGYYFGVSILEPIIGIVLAILIFKVGLEIFIHSSKVLLDAVINYEKLDAIRQIIKAKPRVLAIKTLRARSAGRYYFIYAEVSTSLKLIKKVIALKNELETAIKKQFPELYEVTIHLEPEKKEIIRIAIPLSENNGLSSEIATHFGSAPYFAFSDYKGKELINLTFQKNPFLAAEKQKGILVGDWLAENSVDKLIARDPLKGGAKLSLEKHLIDVELTSLKILNEFET